MQKECRQGHNRYLCDMFNPDSDRAYKNLWSYVKCKRHDQVTITPLDVNGVSVSDPEEKTNVINIITNFHPSTLKRMCLSFQT